MSVARQVRRVVILVCIFTLAVSVAGALAQKPAPSLDALERMNDAVDALTRRVWPSVVQIAVTSYGVTREKDAAEETSVVLGRQQSIGFRIRGRCRRLHRDQRARRRERAAHPGAAVAGEE